MILGLITIGSPNVELCGYSIPHPSEAKMNLRIQTYGMCTANAGCFNHTPNTFVQMAPRRVMRWREGLMISWAYAMS